MMANNGPEYLEYNVRIGGPETQTLLPLMSKDTDLAEIVVACTEEQLNALSVTVYVKPRATVVVAAGGYHGPYPKTTPMKFSLTDTVIFYASTIIKDG
jgi:phosphoribosylamine--glycine ligase/phosphoribosylformylglycinamidine cyclo-ligase